MRHTVAVPDGGQTNTRSRRSWRRRKSKDAAAVPDGAGNLKNAAAVPDGAGNLKNAAAVPDGGRTVTAWTRPCS